MLSIPGVVAGVADLSAITAAEAEVEKVVVTVADVFGDDDIVTSGPWSHILGDIGANRSGDEVLVSATDSPSLLHLESIFLRFSFRS